MRIGKSGVECAYPLATRHFLLASYKNLNICQRPFSWLRFQAIDAADLVDAIFHIRQAITKWSRLIHFKSFPIILYYDLDGGFCIADRNNYFIAPGVLGNIVE